MNSRNWIRFVGATAVAAWALSGCGDGTSSGQKPTTALVDAEDDSTVVLGDASKSDTAKPDTAKADTAATDTAGPGDSASGNCAVDADCAGKVANLGVCEKAICSSGECKAAPADDGDPCIDDNKCFTDRVCKANKCQGGKPIACQDNNPCTDNKCDPKVGCVATPNQAPCDDGDPCTADDTCADGNCKGGTVTCQSGPEIDCANGKDDDSDGNTDCADNDCASTAACKGAGTEVNCADQLDNDKDGATDCADTDCAADAACKLPATEVDCKNGKDDDGDKAIDCADNDCAADPTCQVLPGKEANCADQLDDDKDGATDCADTDCAANAACTGGKESDCKNGLDDDKDGATDCKDNDCSVDVACASTVTTEADCKNAKDDDLDGMTDCKDSDCAKDPACVITAKETKCADKVDDDKDGATDCADLDCAADPACKAACDVCTANPKPLKSGCDPCVDIVCAADDYCCTQEWDSICVGEVATICKKQCSAPKTETVCNDKIDDDKDGATDCADSDCAKDAACAGKETLCADKLDNDKDGMTDCQDADCKADLACQASACVDDFAMACGGTEQHNNAGTGSTSKLSGYTCTDGNANGESGSEYTYSYVAACDGPVVATLVKQSTKAGYLDMFVLDAAKGCVASSCIAHALMTGNQATKTFTAIKDHKYFIVVDGYQGFSADYTLKVTCGCAGGKETNCTDKVDNDGDKLVDCADADCAADLACAPTVETSCTDKVDNDKDTKVDCADSDCAKNLACAPTMETACSDKIDEDLDGKTDCADADCAKDTACTGGTPETLCADKLDNDKDGATDCADSDCAKDAACLPPVGETLCTDKVDNDKDGLVDCADPDCSGKGTCVCKTDYPLDCNSSDSWSNNGVGSTSAVSTWVCKDGTMGSETGPEYAYDYVASCDGELTVTLTKTSTTSGFLDLFLLDAGQTCGSNACVAHALMGTTTATQTTPVKMGQKLSIVVDGYNAYQGNYSIKTTCKCGVTTETSCTNKLDDDKDGKTDCADSDCAKDAACVVPTIEANCTDKLDNDKDGKTDCADTDCAKDVACGGPVVEANCTDKVDNDKDGKTDCADSDCAANLACIVTQTETLCADKLDNDKDGKTDCADSDCAKDTACVTPTTETLCADKLDNDKDGKTDCADSDCAADVACVPANICQPDYPMSCGAQDTYSNNGTGSTKLINTWQCADGSMSGETGAEYTYEYTAACDGPVTATLTKTATTSGYIDLFILDSAKGCTANACLVHGLMGSNSATVTWTAKKGQKYFVVADGYNNYSANYTLKTNCSCTVPATETNCTDKLDDDKDGKTDCADSDCAKNAACVAPPAYCAPGLGMACGGSDKYNNGGTGSTKVIDAWTCADGPASGSYSGPEYTYAYAAICTGAVTVTVKRTSTATSGYLDLFILDGAKSCSPSSCLVHQLMVGDTVTKTFDATQGKVYNFVIDGYSGAVEDYQFNVSCACK